MKKTDKPQEGALLGHTGRTRLNKHHEIKTDQPLSEKDEVKQAEENMRRAAKKK
jgi:hypothetical protein